MKMMWCTGEEVFKPLLSVVDPHSLYPKSGIRWYSINVREILLLIGQRGKGEEILPFLSSTLRISSTFLISLCTNCIRSTIIIKGFS